ncbi:hypothetical protein [Amycolatopsis sp. MEPSY49]
MCRAIAVQTVSAAVAGKPRSSRNFRVVGAVDFETLLGLGERDS